LGDEYGWKQVHGDVFRSASYPLLFSSLVGTGYQLAVVGFLVIIMSIVGDLYTEYVLCVFIGYLFISIVLYLHAILPMSIYIVCLDDV
jgi:hypothetical protein